MRPGPERLVLVNLVPQRNLAPASISLATIPSLPSGAGQQGGAGSLSVCSGEGSGESEARHDVGGEAGDGGDVVAGGGDDQEAVGAVDAGVGVCQVQADGGLAVGAGRYHAVGAAGAEGGGGQEAPGCFDAAVLQHGRGHGDSHVG